MLSQHASLPFGESYYWQTADFEATAAWVAQQKSEGCAVVVIGDFNTTRWSAAFRRLVRQGDLHDAREGFGIGTTWPTGLPLPMRIPIDQCVNTTELVTRDFRVLEANGSDHLPLRVELGWR